METLSVSYCSSRDVRRSAGASSPGDSYEAGRIRTVQSLIIADRKPPGLSSQNHRPAFDIWARGVDSRYARNLERGVSLNVDLMSHRDARHRTGQCDRLRFAHRQQQRGNMKDRKKAPEDSKEPQNPDQSSDIASDDDTQRLRTLTVQELERLLKDKKPGP